MQSHLATIWVVEWRWSNPSLVDTSQVVHHPIIPGGAPSHHPRWCTMPSSQVVHHPHCLPSNGFVHLPIFKWWTYQHHHLVLYHPKDLVFKHVSAMSMSNGHLIYVQARLYSMENNHFYEPITSKGTPPIQQLGTLSSSPTPDLDDATVIHRFKLFNVQPLKGNIHSSRNNSGQLSRIGISSSKHTLKIMEHTELKKHI